MFDLGCENGILFMKLEKTQKGSDVGRKSSIGSITLWSWGSPAWCPQESMGQLGEAGMDTNGCLIIHRDECWEGKGDFESATGAEDPEGVRTGL